MRYTTPLLGAFLRVFQLGFPSRAFQCAVPPVVVVALIDIISLSEVPSEIHSNDVYNSGVVRRLSYGNTTWVSVEEVCMSTMNIVGKCVHDVKSGILMVRSSQVNVLGTDTLALKCHDADLVLVPCAWKTYTQTSWNSAGDLEDRARCTARVLRGGVCRCSHSHSTSVKDMVVSQQ